MAAPPSKPAAVARLVGLCIATLILLFLPDLLLYWQGYTVTAAASVKQLFYAVVIALLVSTARSRKFRMAALTFLVVNQLVWTGYVVYFGEALSPEHLLLFQEEPNDTALGVLDAWRSFLPWLVTLLVGGLILATIQWRERDYARLRSRVSGSAFVVLVVTATAIWMFQPRINVAFPGKHTASFYGPYQALVGAFRLGMTEVAAEGLNIHGQTQQEVALPTEPVTVVVVMGESINASRLSVLGFKADTTPVLAKWRLTPPDGFTLIPQIGFSGGLDTFASVPAFLRAAYWPVQAQKFGVSLFDLAHLRGFKSWYFSAQTLNYLEAAGGAPHAERIEAVLNDDELAGLAAAVPDRGDNNFIFLHQRVNHTPYTSNCAPAEGLYIFDNDAGSADERRKAAYDNGLRCWDRDVAALIKPFLARHGAVHIFITADHSELMAENGRWGHGFVDLRVAMVPMMLLTNRPQSDVASLFKSQSPPTAYRLSQTVALALGVRLDTSNISTSRFFLNGTMPFALAGFLEVEQLERGLYRVKNFSRNGQLVSQETTNLPEAAAATASMRLTHHSLPDTLSVVK